MKRFRLFLLPIGAILELLTLAVSWVLAFIKPDYSERIVSWAKTILPTLEWYIGRR